MIVTPHLQAYYRFENNGLDSSGKGNHLTAVGATYGAGKVGNGAIYDGVDDYHNGGNILNLGLDSWFISLWIKPVTTAGVICGILSKSAAGGYPNRYGIWYENNQLVALFNTSTQVAIPVTNTPVNQWTNIMVNIDRLGLLTLYINLINKGSVNISGYAANNITSLFHFRIGAYTDGSNNPIYFLRGQIDEVLMYNKTMNETDRKRIFCNMHPLNG
jgi:hypothetical protein